MHMNNTSKVMVAAVTAAALTACKAHRTSVPAHTADARIVRVLFVGNSYTGYGAIPRRIEEIVNLRVPARRLSADACLLGGANMKMHFEKRDDNPLVRISTGQYDWVMLQGGASLFLPDRQGIFREYLPKFIEACRAHGSVPILVCTWSTARTLDGIKTQIAFYEDARTNFNVALVPLAEAWLRVLEEKPELGMYVDTTGHPSALGVYLNLCVYYAVFTGRSPLGLAFDVPPIAIAPEHEAVFRTNKYVTLDTPVMSYLQQVAAETAARYTAWNQTRISVPATQ